MWRYHEAGFLLIRPLSYSSRPVRDVLSGKLKNVGIHNKTVRGLSSAKVIHKVLISL